MLESFMNGKILPLLAFFDDNVLDPISRRGQDDVYEQLEILLASIDPEFKKDFEPCYSIEAFFERIGKKGDFWEGFNIYNETSIPRNAFEDFEKVADAIEEIQMQNGLDGQTNSLKSIETEKTFY